jgi:hypothetical protein
MAAVVARGRRVAYLMSGTVTGELWWPTGVPATKTFEYRQSDPTSLRDLCEAVMDREAGDFSGGIRFMADATVTLIRYRPDGLGFMSRTWDLAAFPSIRADYLTDEWPSSGEN